MRKGLFVYLQDQGLHLSRLCRSFHRNLHVRFCHRPHFHLNFKNTFVVHVSCNTNLIDCLYTWCSGGTKWSGQSLNALQSRRTYRSNHSR